MYFFAISIPSITCSIINLALSSKLRSFAHQEFSSPEYSNEEIIKENISNHRDLFKRNLNYEKVELDKTFPKFILENKDLFKEWIV